MILRWAVTEKNTKKLSNLVIMKENAISFIYWYKPVNKNKIL